MKELVDKLNYYTKLYDEGHPLVSDKEWDDMYFTLLKKEREVGYALPNSSTYRIDYQVVSELRKLKHNHPMLSLAKTKYWSEFLGYFTAIDPSKDIVGMIKVDGLTCSLRYLDGRLVSAETRGNGTEGEDILHNALVVQNIPKKIDYKEELIIDGEIICTTKDFEEFKGEYANPRNFASGSIRLLDSNECAKRKLKFIAWNVVSHNWDTVMDSFTNLTNLGFTVVPWTSSFDWDAKEFLIEQAKKFGIPIDGLVGRFNNIAFGDSLGATGHHSRAAYAFKFYDEEYVTWLNDIEFTMGRTGVLTPIAVFNPVDTGDSIVERASLHNLTIMKQLLGTPYNGQTITIYKANMIIPQVSSGGVPECKADIEGLEIKIPTVCPVCGGILEVVCDVDTEVLMCRNSECPGKLINRLDHFCSKKGLDIKGLSKATLTKLVEWGWINELADLYKLCEHSTEWVMKPGFGGKSVENILNAIEKSRQPQLDAFISALGIPMIGINIAKDLIKYVDSYEDFRNKAKSKWDFTQIDGIAYEKASAIWNFDFAEADRVDDYMLGYELPESTSAVSQTLDGKSVCITGRLIKFKNRDELVNEIQTRGGKVVSGVSKNTHYLINNDTASGSTKNQTAKKLGIPIVSEEEFIKNFFN